MHLPSRFKQAVRTGLEYGLALLGPQRLHSLKTENLLILMYHRVLPADHPDRAFEQPGMYVSPQTFRMHMQLLQARFSLMHLSAWIEKVARRETLPKYACAVTFDDGWRDNYDYAYPVLRELQIPASIFVVPEFVGTDYSFWPNRLARLLGRLKPEALQALLTHVDGRWLSKLPLSFDLRLARTPLQQVHIDEMIVHCKAFNDEDLSNRLDCLEAGYSKPHKKQPDMLDWPQLAEMQSSGLIEIGSHTCTHRRLLENLGANVLRREIADSKTAITRHLQQPVSLFCYPNGDYCPRALDTVRQHYRAACTTEKGWNTPADDLFRLKRIGVHEDIAATQRGFLARIGGLL